MAEGIARELRDQSMILVQIVAEVREDHVRGQAGLERFELLLDFLALVWEEAVAEGLQGHRLALGLGQEKLRAVSRLLLPRPLRAPDYPRYREGSAPAGELEDRPAAPDLDGVGVSANPTHHEGRVPGLHADAHPGARLAGAASAG